MPSLAEQSDAELARLAKSGELAAFDELARRYQVPLRRYAARFVRAADVEDLVQDTLVNAFRRLGQYRESHSLKSWLFAIAHHAAIDRLRQRRVSTSQAGEIAIDNNPADHAESAERRRSLWAIAREFLSDAQYSAVWLFYVEDLTASEIAKVQKRSWVSVKVMLHRARTTLAQSLPAAEWSDRPEPARVAEAGDV